MSNNALNIHNLSILLNWKNNQKNIDKFSFFQKMTHKLFSLFQTRLDHSFNHGLMVGLQILHCLVLSDQPSIIDQLRTSSDIVKIINKLEHEAYKSIPSYSSLLNNTVSSTWQYHTRIIAASLGMKPWRSKYRGHQGVRILCLDGGGTRGVATIRVLQQLKK